MKIQRLTLMVLAVALPTIGAASPQDRKDKVQWTSVERTLGSDHVTTELTIGLLTDIGRSAIPVLVENLDSTVVFQGSTGLLARSSAFEVVDDDYEWPDCSIDRCHRVPMVGEVAAYLIRWILGGRQHAETPQIVLAEPQTPLSGQNGDELCAVLDFLKLLKRELSSLEASGLSPEHFDRILLSHGASFSEEPDMVAPGEALFGSELTCPSE